MLENSSNPSLLASYKILFLQSLIVNCYSSQHIRYCKKVSLSINKNPNYYKRDLFLIIVTEMSNAKI